MADKSGNLTGGSGSETWQRQQNVAKTAGLAELAERSVAVTIKCRWQTEIGRQQPSATKGDRVGRQTENMAARDD